MAEPNRRVIFKVQDLDDAARAQLAEQLEAAVDWQQALAAKSPHVLQFISGVQESEKAFWIEHEPASPYFDVQTLFDGQMPELDTKKMMRVACALIHALKVAHESKSGEFGAHGAVCPGTVLITPDGIEKVSDFGFANVVCNTLGPDAYLNLAISHQTMAAEEMEATGAWEVLSPDEFDREDRLCAFIDPEKFGNGVYNSFEPRSDIIGAAFVLHLMAEHKHPYLFEEDAHRLVDMSAMMAMNRYNGARRSELRESSDPGIQVWCAVVAEMLARVSVNRPSAVQLAERLGEHVKPVDTGELLRRRVEAAERFIGTEEWSRLRSAVVGVVDAQDVPEDVAEKARGLFELAESHHRFAEAKARVEAGDWSGAKTALDRLPAPSALPAEIAAESHEMAATINQVVELHRKITGFVNNIPTWESQAPASRINALHKAIDETQRIKEDASLPESFRAPLDGHLERFQSVLAAAENEQAEIEARQREEQEKIAREREESAARAREWIEGAEAALADGDFDNVAEILADRPELTYWPAEIDEKIRQVQKAHDDEMSRRAREAEEQADREAATEWMATLQASVEAEEWAEARRILDDSPRLRFFPADIRDESTSLGTRIDEEIKRAAEQGQADGYLDQLQSLIDAENWSEAGDCLGNRPALTYWPDEALEREAAFRAMVQENLEAVELQRRQIAAWVESIEAAVGESRFDEAIRLASSPPVSTEVLPDEDQSKAASLADQAHEGLAKAQDDARAQATRLVSEAAVALTARTVNESFSDFVESDLINVDVSDVEFSDPNDPSDGRAVMTLQCQRVKVGEDAPPAISFTFQGVRNGAVSIEGQDVGSQLATAISTFVAQGQRGAFEAIRESLVSGAFPEALVEADLASPEKKIGAQIQLLPGEDSTPIATALIWDSRLFRFSVEDVSKIADVMVKAAVDGIREEIPKRIAAADALLQAHQGMLEYEASPGEVSLAMGIPEMLPVNVQVKLRTPGARKARLVGGTIIDCKRVGEIPDDFAGADVVTAFHRFMVETQVKQHDALQTEAEDAARAADAKFQTWLTPATIESPAEKVVIEVGRKRRGAAKVEIPWSQEKFAFAPAEGWVESLKTAATAEPAKKKGMGLIAGVAGLVVTVGAIGGYVAFSGGNDGPQVNGNGPPDNGNSSQQVVDNTTNNDNAGPIDNGDPTPSIAPDYSQAVSDAKGIIRTSCNGLVDPHALNLVALADVPAGDSPRIDCRIPGIDQPQVSINVIQDGSNWILDPAGRNTLERRATTLGNALDLTNQPLSEILAILSRITKEQGLAGIIEADQLAVAIDPGQNLSWNFNEDEDRWTIYQVRISINNANGGNVYVQDLETAWEVSGGIRRLLDEGPDTAESMISTALTTAMAQLQSSKAEELTTQIQDYVDIPDNVVPDFTITDTPVTRLTWSVSLPGLLDRRLQADWNSSILIFRMVDTVEGSWENQLDAAILLADTLTNVNQTSNWITKTAKSPVTEAAEPMANGFWTLETTAPWATADAEGNFAPEDKLTIRVNTDIRSAADVAGAKQMILDNQPPLWSALAAYVDLQGNAFPCEDSRFRAAFAETMGVDVNRFRYLSPKVTAMSASLQGAGSSSAQARSVTVSFNAGWSAADAPDGVDLRLLREAVEALNLAPEPLTLVLRGETGGGVQVSWTQGGALSEDLPSILALDKRLTQFTDRLSLQADLDAWLPSGADLRDLSSSKAQALDFLKRIWTLKEVSVTDGASFDEVAEDLANSQEPFTKDGVFSPTIFAECFCGPDSCFTICWSMDTSPAVTKGPILRKSLPADDAYKATDLDNAIALLGTIYYVDIITKSSLLLEDAIGAGNNYEGTLGLAIGLDDPLQFLNLGTASLPQKESRLRLVGNPEVRPSMVRWTSLDELRGTDRLGDYQLVGSLSGTPGPRLRDPKVQWAHQALQNSLPIR
ncbi:MAG: hypothetical protein ACYTHJ_17535 [Planctomycetota bacterium]|jgi:hypothetical protein